MPKRKRKSPTKNRALNSLTRPPPRLINYPTTQFSTLRSSEKETNRPMDARDSSSQKDPKQEIPEEILQFSYDVTSSIFKKAKRPQKTKFRVMNVNG
mmetsp:Transcript_29913/g.114851  ORF Transcript_29913/g.114851 Transcript_29913/m.114851 type:complete len:97 (+) Transcript_29913:3036-3326(+)